MNWIGVVFSLPLLTKDLIEMSSRRRTFALRLVYAVILYFVAFTMYYNLSAADALGISQLGRGQEIFQSLIWIQSFAIILLMPAICCGAITSEKERDTLGLLLITRLSPQTIILEKLLGRLVNMGTYQLLSLPLFAIVYGIGGVELGEIITAIWMLAMLTIVVATGSIFCSVWYRTTSGAFIASYLLMPFCWAYDSLFVMLITEIRFDWIWTPVRLQTWFGALFAALSSAIVFMFLSIAFLIPIFIAINVSQSILLQRAFIPPKNVLLDLFKVLDAFFHELNELTTKGIVLVKDREDGPVDDPIAWRETRKKSLGTVRYLFRLLMVLEAPLALAIIWTITDIHVHDFDGPTIFFLMTLWPISALAIAVHTTNVLASERSRQTLDVLLTTPLSTRELIRQKLAGVHRLILVLSIPLITLLIFHAVWRSYVVRGLSFFDFGSRETSVFLHEILGMMAAIVIYPHVIKYLAFNFAMRMKNQTQIVLLSLAVIIVTCIGPLIFSGIFRYVEPIFSQTLPWLSPVRVLFHRAISGVAPSSYPRSFNANAMTINEPEADSSFGGLTLHILFFIGVWYLLKRLAIANFSKLMSRTEADTKHTGLEPST